MASMQPMRSEDFERRLEMVREGMKVVDASGHDIGRVDYVQMSDPEAATNQGEVVPPSGTIVVAPSSVAGTAGSGTSNPVIAAPIWPADDSYGPEVPGPIRDRLIHYGYFRVDGPFLFGKDRYVRADLIAGVHDNTVTLSVDKEELPVKGENF